MTVPTLLRMSGIIVCMVLIVLPSAVCFRGPHPPTSKSIEFIDALLPFMVFVLVQLCMAEGCAREQVKGLRGAVRSLCRIFSIPLTAERQDELQQMDATALEALRERLERERRWPSA